MTKKQFFKIILYTVLVTIFFNLIFERFLIAKISTLPFLNRLKILSPQAPIVINNRETVRVSETGDAVVAANSVKSKLSLVAVVTEDNNVEIKGSAVNLTSDGSFITGLKTFETLKVNYFVLLSDGRSAKITETVIDPATSLVFFKAKIDNVPVSDFGDSQNLIAGEKILFVRNSVQSFTNQASLGVIKSSQKDLYGKIFESDFPKASFGVGLEPGLLTGEAVVSSKGDILGIWNGNEIVASSNLKQAVSLFYNNNSKIVRPSFGFTYKIITKNENLLSALPEGAMVKNVALNSATYSKLLAGDIIVEINGRAVNENSNLEEMLQKFSPGEKVELKVIRNKQSTILNIMVGELKIINK